MELIFVRHGEPEWSNDGMAVNDPPLTDRGHEQADLAAKALADRSVDQLLVSPLARAQQTAAPIADALGIESTTLPWLAEIRSGDWEGTPQEVVERTFRESRDRPLEQQWDGIPGGESFRDFHERVTAGFTSLFHEQGAERVSEHPALWHLERPERRVVVVAHGGTNAVSLGFLLGIEPVPWEWERFVSFHASVSTIQPIEISGGHSFSLFRFSDIAHLPDALQTRADVSSVIVPPMPSEAYDGLVAMLTGARVTPELPTEQARTGWDSMEAVLPLAPDVTIEDVTIGVLAARWVTPPGAGGTTVLHLHGGGYVIGSAKSHTPFASHLAATLGARVLLLVYRLAPEHPAPTAIDDAVAAFQWLLETGTDPADIVFCGDSAGAGLAVATMAQLRDTLQPLPGAAALISPWTDATFDYETMRTKVDEDIILSPELMQHWRGLYAGSMPFDDPRLSPALGDLEGLPPIHVQVGTREILLDDARQFADKASGAGVDVTLEVCDEMIHIWPVLGAGVTPEAQAAIDRIAAFVQS